MCPFRLSGRMTTRTDLVNKLIEEKKRGRKREKKRNEREKEGK